MPYNLLESAAKQPSFNSTWGSYYFAPIIRLLWNYRSDVAGSTISKIIDLKQYGPSRISVGR